MPNYQNGKIYKLWSLLGDDIYIGSTSRPLSERLAEHVHSFKCNKLKSTSKILFKKYDIDNVQIELIENHPCNSKEELHKREGHYIRTLDCVNKCIAGRTQQEYNQDNAEKIKEQRKTYRQENADKIKEYLYKNKDKIKENKKEYYERNKDIISKKQKEYHYKNNDKIKEYEQKYYQDNQDKIKQQRKQYRQENADKINAIHTCECGDTYTHHNKARHFRTDAHKWGMLYNSLLVPN